VLQSNQFLESLDLSDNLSPRNRLSQSLENDVMMHISKMVRLNDTLIELSLSKMGISDWVMVNLLSSAIGQNTCLRTLDLGCNKITRDGSIALSQAMCSQDSIKTLILSSNSIQDEGAEAVSVMLLHNKTLQTLNLEYNKITGKGLKSLAWAVARNQNLASLKVWGNVWNVDACEAFSKLVGGTVRDLTTTPINLNNPSSSTDLHSGSSTMLKQDDRAQSASTTQKRPHGHGGLKSLALGRLRPQNLDVVFYSVEGVLQVARNVW
jgi:Ran GTPase-activating protein (RanGAP) involved in mRNA processing and transport